jgi:hypothetical protein
MRTAPLTLAAVLLATLTAAACQDGPLPTAARAGSPRYHVGYKGVDEPLGFLTNDAECHVGKKGDRWPLAEQYDVKTFDAHLGITPSGVVTLVCHGEIPAGQPLPARAEVEKAVLCFLPGQRETRDAQEVFTPSGEIVLTCHLNPNGE